MNKLDQSSRLIVIAQFMIGLVVSLGLAAFVSLNPYLITMFAVAQLFIIVGVLLFVVALLAGRAEVVNEKQLNYQTSGETYSHEREAPLPEEFATARYRHRVRWSLRSNKSRAFGTQKESSEETVSAVGSSNTSAMK